MPGQVSQMFEQALDALKGWFHLSALDKSAKLKSSLLTGVTSVPAGRVAVLDDNGEFILDRAGGATLTNKATAMPIFLWNGKDHADVYNDGTSPTTSTVHWYGISPTGVMSGLVATGGYELQTTEYDADAVAGYKTNQPLTATAAGILTSDSATPYTNWICGIASFHVQSQVGYLQPDSEAAATSPVGTNAHGVSTLTFWTYFLPAAA